MKITEDVRKYAAQDEDQMSRRVEQGLAGKSGEFQHAGSEIYAKAVSDSATFLVPP